MISPPLPPPFYFFPYEEKIDQLTDLGQVTNQDLLFSVINRDGEGELTSFASQATRSQTVEVGSSFPSQPAEQHVGSIFVVMGISKTPPFASVFPFSTSVVAGKGEISFARSLGEGMPYQRKA